MTDNKWVRFLAYVTGLVNQKLLLQNEYLNAENRILRSHLAKRLRLNNPERSTLTEIDSSLDHSRLSGGILGSKLFNKRGDGVVMDIILGIVGAIAGGFRFQLVRSIGSHRAKRLQLCGGCYWSSDRAVDLSRCIRWYPSMMQAGSI